MTASARTPGVWATLTAAVRDASAVVRKAPGLTALTTALAFAEALTYLSAYDMLEKGLPTALLSMVDTVVVCLLVAPLSVATFRWVLLDERPGLTGLADKLDVLITFTVVTAAIWSVAFAPLTLMEGVDPETAPGRFWTGFGTFLVLAALSVRLWFLQPAVATRSVLASLGASWRMTRGVSWRMLGALGALFIPALAIVVALAVLVESDASYATATIVALLNVLLSLVGSAVIARYYAWRLTQA